MSGPLALPKDPKALEALVDSTARKNALVVVVLADFGGDQTGVAAGGLKATVSITIGAGRCLPAGVLDATIRDLMPRLGKKLGALVKQAEAAQAGEAAQ